MKIGFTERAEGGFGHLAVYLYESGCSAISYIQLIATASLYSCKRVGI